MFIMKKYLLLSLSICLLTACQSSSIPQTPTSAATSSHSPIIEKTVIVPTSPTVQEQTTLPPSGDPDIEKLDQLFNELNEDDFNENDLSDQVLGNK